MNASRICRNTCVLAAAFLFAGCSGGGGAPSAPAVPPASAPTSRTTPASPDHVAQDAAPAASASPSAPPVLASTPSPVATASMPRPAENQVDQASLAERWSTAIEVPREQTVPAPDATTRAARTISQAITRDRPTAIRTDATIAKSRLRQHVPSLSHESKRVATRIADATATSAAPSGAALRQAKFKLLATRFNHPTTIRTSDIPAGPKTLEILKAGNVGIANFDDAVRVHFALKASPGDWTNQYLDPRQSREFGCGMVDECLFWMQTRDRSPVYYVMHRDLRYAIFWDPAHAIWDLQVADQGDPEE